MNHLDLFTGIGGFSLAASWMGWETVAQVEWDKWCQKVLAKNFPNSLRFGDIKEFNDRLENGEIITDSEGERLEEWSRNKQGETEAGFRQDCIKKGSNYGRYDLGRINIITGGFPCQPFSHAGKRAGVSDERYLWPEMLRTIRILKPGFVVGENVAGLVSMENGKTLDRILSDLENEGYTTEQVIIPACAVGAWHRRDRIWIVGRRIIPNAQSGQSSSKYNGRKPGEISQQEQREFRGVGCEISSNSISQRQQAGRECNQPSRQKWTPGNCYEGRRQWQSEPCMGGLVDGLPDRLAGWDREPEGVPRVATGVKDKVNKLKGLGNAIVPAVVYELFKAIQKLHDENIK